LYFVIVGGKHQYVLIIISYGGFIDSII